MNTSRIARAVVVGVAGLAAVGTVTACGSMVTDTRSDDAEVTEPITAVRFDNGGGNVTIRVGDTTSVHREIHYNDEEPGRTHRVDGDVLVLDPCGKRNCWVDYEVVVPAGTSVDGVTGSGDLDVRGVAKANLKTGSGDVTASGVEGRVTVGVGSGTVRLTDVGDVTVRSGSGDVTLDDVRADAAVRAASGGVNVTNVRGAVRLRADSGDVEARGIGGAARVQTASGEVTVELSAAQDVTASAASGDITVTVPKGSYRVNLTSASGDVTSEIDDDASGAHELNLEAASGNVTVEES